MSNIQKEKNDFANFGWALEQMKIGYAVRRTVIKNGAVIISENGCLMQMDEQIKTKYPYVPTNEDIHAIDWQLIVAD